MNRLLLLTLLCGLSDAEVTFTHSELYDQYDIFQPFTTTFINTLCKSGCSVYASLPSDDLEATKEARKVIISDLETEMSLYDIAHLYDPATSKKLPFDFPAKPRVVSIRYPGNVIGACPVVLYVLSNAGKPTIPFKVYDARTMKRAVSTSKIMTILSPEPFNVGTEASQLGNSVTAYTAGMDNAVENGGPMSVDQGAFPGFILNFQTSILSFHFNMDTPVSIYARMVYSTVTGFDQFLSSPGFIRCYGMQVYRSSYYQDSLEHTVSGDKIAYLKIDALLNTGEYSSVNLLNIKWHKTYTRSAFLLRFSASDSPPSTTAAPATTTNSAVGSMMIVDSMIE